MMQAVPDLGPAVNAVVRRCLGVTQSEDVLVIVDQGTQEIGEAVQAEAAQAGADAVLALMEERENDVGLGGTLAAERIADYMGAYGRDRVEDFLDACHTIAIHQPQAQLIRKAPVPEPEHQPKPFDVLFPDEVSADRERVAEDRAALRARFPREPQEDLLSFIEAHARGL